MEPNEAVTLGVVVARLEDLRKDFADFRSEIRQAQAASVPREEYEEHKRQVNRRFEDTSKDVSDIRTEMAARRPPWWVVLSPIAALASVAVAVIIALSAK